MGTSGAVTCGHPLGSVAGTSILQRGGNAVDAIVAMAAAVGVVEPNMSGVGGDGFTLVYLRDEGKVYTVNGSGPAPKRATLDAYRDGIPDRGPRSVSVPGAVAGWALMHGKWGALTFEDALQPAIALAEDGFPVSHNLAMDLAQAAAVFSQFDYSTRIFLPGGNSTAAGHLLRQPDLAASLREIAASGGEALYRGQLGQRLAESVQRDGGLLDEESLADFQAEIQEPLSTSYRGFDVYEPGLNSTGHVLLQELAMSDHLTLTDWANPSGDLIHRMVEIKKLAFDDREKHAADPRFIGEFPRELMSADYAAGRLKLVDGERARAQVAMDQAAGGDTTYLAAVDRDGNIASMTTSINNSFGSGYVAGDTGILLNNRMTYWYLEPDHPNVLEPGKRTRHTVSPAILLRDGAPAMAIGTPGSDGQVQTIFQVLVNMIDFGMNPQDAVERPRWRSFVDGQEANWPHTHANELHVEGRMPAEVVEALQAKGHAVVRLEPWAMGVGSVQTIRINEAGAYEVGSDPRRDAYGLAY